MLESLTVSDFETLVGERFLVHSPSDGVTHDTELVEAVSAASAGGRRGRAPFSLVFRGGSDVVLPQRIYRVDHAQLGSLEIFLVPIGPDAEGMRYEAIFT